MAKARQRNIKYVALSALKPNPRNPRQHSRVQVEAIAKSITAFGFNSPILIDRFDNVVAGHGRLEAGKILGLTEVPVICLDKLSESQARAYMIADNRLTDKSSWNDEVLAVHLKELSDLALDFDIQATGFELPEIDLRIGSLDEATAADDADEYTVATGPAVSRLGDRWQLDKHRILCGNALERASFTALMDGDDGAAAITDFPYNLKINGHVSGLGAAKHREFVMASGEMSDAEFGRFLMSALALIKNHLAPGALTYGFMDWRHMGEMLLAGRANGFDLMNLCVWVKTNGGMGSFYRSRHELIFVFRNGKAAHQNNIQLGRFGRNRTNVWNYAGANVRSAKGKEAPLAFHPTVKPIMLVADAIRDSTVRGDIILDPFLGSGTAILAAERTNRRGYGVELDPLYVDTAICRWQRMTGHSAVHTQSGQTFDQIAADRRNHG